MSREKGKRFERQLAGFFREYGYKTKRSAQYCGKTGEAADVVGLPGIHIEAKHQERMRLYEWMEQAMHDAAAAGDGLPVVIHKKNNAETLVTMRLEDWIQLYREWEAGILVKRAIGVPDQMILRVPLKGPDGNTIGIVSEEEAKKMVDGEVKPISFSFIVTEDEDEK